MSYKQGENRDQLTIIPMCLDDYVAEDNVCRVIAAYVGSLDMKALGFKYAETKNIGCPPYDPASMLQLYLYGYMNRIRSSRRLEAETHRNVEVMWLIEKLTPDDKTICNFRKDNAKALKNAFREFSLMCSRMGLYGKELVAVDGSKFRANSSRHSIHSKKYTEKELSAVEKKISEYMNELERNDSLESSEPRLSPDTIRDVLQHLKEKKCVLQDWLNRIEANDGKEISTVDPDARIMKQGGDGRALDACYNVQTAVDSEHKLIVDFEVTTNANDKGALPQMTERAKEIMGVDKISVDADKGYYDGEDIEKCEKNGTTCYIPKAENSAKAPDPRYNRKHFKYDKATDSYLCPAGTRLDFTHTESENLRIYSNYQACKSCSERSNCTKDKKGGRKISRIPTQDTLDSVDARMKTDGAREIFRERKKIVEHPFGTIKKIWGFNQFLCRGKEKTTGEASLSFLAYNFRRVVNICRENRLNMVEMMA